MSDRDAKLALIAGLTLGEIEGWRDQIAQTPGRPFDGEAEALARRNVEIQKGSR